MNMQLNTPRPETLSLRAFRDYDHKNVLALFEKLFVEHDGKVPVHDIRGTARRWVSNGRGGLMADPQSITHRLEVTAVEHRMAFNAVQSYERACINHNNIHRVLFINHAVDHSGPEPVVVPELAVDTDWIS